jgi:hypothetical protein
MSLSARLASFCEPRKHSGLAQTPYNRWGTREIRSRVFKHLITDHRSTSLTVEAAESDEVLVLVLPAA